MKQTPLHITMIDNDLNFMKTLTFSLENDFRFTTFNEPKIALEFIQQNATDAVLLDLHLQETSGLTVCRQIKNLNVTLPVFFLTSDCNVSSISQGMAIGGTDFFNKSIPSEELTVRVKARLSLNNNSHLLTCGELKLDLEACLLFINSKEVRLTPKEYDIIKVFMERPDVLITKADLLNLLWRDVYVDPNNIDTHMFHLRKKLIDSSTKIQTKKGLGYILRAHVR
jgi:DNA-binding response OmpR family regulator